ncbi:COG1470 family protein [Methanolobus psychrotolerans]|uniref:COG1470 family protein n=1 Tax=Methanolobus psychrotolerans TaxID=1874706 RepID=UPI000B9177C3|nr:hypothetical protein [Methanolobus psychrotolerans]
MKQKILLFMGLAVLLMNFCGVVHAQSDEIEWLDAQEYTLYWGDEVNHSGYFIKAADFSPAKPKDTENDYVMLTITSIYHDSWGAILANNTEISNNTAFDDRLNITALEIVTGNDIPSPYTVISVALSNSTGSLPVKIKWMDATFEFEKKNSDEVYIDERAYFTLEIKNLKGIPLESVSIQEFIPQEFVFDPDSEIKWNLSFEPFETKTVSYSLKALRPGTYAFNGTLIRIEHEGRTYSKELNASNIIVHGPFINLSKSMSSDSINLHDEVNITLNIANEGDRAAYVTVSDQLPVGAVLLSGDTGKSRVLRADESFSLTYSVRMDKAGDIVIPATRAKFVDSKEYEGTVYSIKKLIHVKDPNEVMTEDAYDDQVYSDDYSYDEEYEAYQDDAVQTGQSVAGEEEDHGKLQFLYDILGSIADFLKNTKDKIL